MITLAAIAALGTTALVPVDAFALVPRAPVPQGIRLPPSHPVTPTLPSRPLTGTSFVHPSLGSNAGPAPTTLGPSRIWQSTMHTSGPTSSTQSTHLPSGLGEMRTMSLGSPNSGPTISIDPNNAGDVKFGNTYYRPCPGGIGLCADPLANNPVHSPVSNTTPPTNPGPCLPPYTTCGGKSNPPPPVPPPSPIGKSNPPNPFTKSQNNTNFISKVGGSSWNVGALFGPGGPTNINIGPTNTGPTNTGPTNTGPVNTGPTNTGPINTGPVNTGPTNTGPINTGPINTGPTNLPHIPHFPGISGDDPTPGYSGPNPPPAYGPTYGQPGYSYAGRPYATQNGGTAYGAPALKAIALSWNANGQWVAQKSTTLDIAGATAMSQCNGQYGQCALSDAAVPQTQFACLAVARGNEDSTRLFAAIGASIDEGRAAVSDQLSQAGMTGRVEYTDCNR
jgi:hypothetical protein